MTDSEQGQLHGSGPLIYQRYLVTVMAYQRVLLTIRSIAECLVAPSGAEDAFPSRQLSSPHVDKEAMQVRGKDGLHEIKEPLPQIRRASGKLTIGMRAEAIFAGRINCATLDDIDDCVLAESEVRQSAASRDIEVIFSQFAWS